MDGLFGPDDPHNGRVFARLLRTRFKEIHERLRHADISDRPHALFLQSEQHPKFCFANARRVLQHRLKTDLSWPGDELMTFKTSDVAVCCSSDSVRSSVRWRNSLRNRVFSMAITAWAAKFRSRSICLSENGRTSLR